MNKQTMKPKHLAWLLLLLPIATFGSDPEPVLVEKLVQTTQSWDGSPLPGYSTGQPEITILRITVQPGVELPWHSHPVINAGVMIRGTITVITKDGETHVLSAGDSIVEVVGKVHRGINRGTEPAEVIVFYAGAVETPLTEVVE